MEHDPLSIRDMQRKIAELESARRNDRLRFDDLRLFLFMLGLVAGAGVFIATSSVALHFSDTVIAYLRAATWTLFAVGGLGLLYVFAVRIRQNDCARRDSLRLKDLEVRSIDRQQAGLSQ